MRQDKTMGAPSNGLRDGNEMTEDVILDQISSYEGEWARLGTPRDRLPLLAAYVWRLMQANQKVNLVSRKLTLDDLIRDHLFDSLLPLPFFPKVPVVFDLGSGGGFPAIPLALHFPSTVFVLIEKSPVKRRFLASLTDLCPNLRIVEFFSHIRSSLGQGLVVARAFKSIDEILRLTDSHLSRRGHYLLYKGTSAKIEVELNHARRLLGRLPVAVQRLSSPLTASQRHVVWIPTPAFLNPDAPHGAISWWDITPSPKAAT